MSRRILCLLLVLGIAGYAAAANWDGEAGDMKWESAFNWDTDALPTLTDQANLNAASTNTAGVTVTSSGVAKTIKLRLYYVGGKLTVASGADLTSNGSYDFYAASGNTGVTDCAGTMNFTSGTVKVGRASYGGTNYLNVSGTLNALDIGMNTTTAGGGAGSVAYLNILDGGVVNTDQILINTDAMDGDARVQLSGTGAMYVTGNATTYLNSVKSNIYGNGTSGNVLIWYSTTTGKTTVAIPEPATIALLGLGGLLLRKRR